MKNSKSTRIETNLGKNIKILRLDRGGKYLSREFRAYSEKTKKERYFFSVKRMWYIPILRRFRKKNMILLDIVKSMTSFANLPISFWGYILEITTYNLTLVP